MSDERINGETIVITIVLAVLVGIFISMMYSETQEIEPKTYVEYLNKYIYTDEVTIKVGPVEKTINDDMTLGEVRALYKQLVNYPIGESVVEETIEQICNKREISLIEGKNE